MSEKKIKKIGILTSGGDAPGMNAAIRALVRAGIHAGFEMYGVKRGYKGLLEGEIIPLGTRDVSEILHRGGTILMTARSKEFVDKSGQEKAKEIMKVYELDALVVIGGDGSFRGAYELSKLGIPVIGIPGTIDNDVSCTDYCIGYDTAMNTALEAIDRIRDTASSHERCSVVEVMGRDAGYIALNVGMACGAEVILI
ncbi:MAG: ATP-dependent 6-phosphofructokinase, partial [Lachnospiraceae bacterium]|nr:ATP-dependent 6-phosphofructokinase [Lachnospiraceae bacterium]